MANLVSSGTTRIGKSAALVNSCSHTGQQGIAGSSGFDAAIVVFARVGRVAADFLAHGESLDRIASAKPPRPAAARSVPAQERLGDGAAVAVAAAAVRACLEAAGGRAPSEGRFASVATRSWKPWHRWGRCCRESHLRAGAEASTGRGVAGCPHVGCPLAKAVGLGRGWLCRCRGVFAAPSRFL